MYCYYSEDIKNCYESAKKGFETWSIKSIKTRIEILSRFVPILKHSGYIKLSKSFYIFSYNILYLLFFITF